MAARFHALVVDDTAVDREVAKKLLETSGFQVTAFGSPKEALDFLDEVSSNNSATIDLILTDYHMPGKTGLELMKAVKESSSWVKNIPVVVMSSEFNDGILCLEKGAHDFIPKPFKRAHAAKLRDDLAANISGADPSGN